MTRKVVESAADNPNKPWLERWREKNFSWKGLAKHQSWQSKDTRSLQEFLRAVERNVTDEELQDRGLLLNCGRRGLYHILFVPEEWVSGKSAVCTPEDLADRKRKYWNKLQNDIGLTERFKGTISGAHLPEDVEQRFAASFRTSFLWVRFKSEVSDLAKEAKRTFRNCAFKSRIVLNGQSHPGPLLFRHCEMEGPVDLQNLSGLPELRFDGCEFAEFIGAVGSNLERLRLDDSSLSGFRLTDTKVEGELVLHGCTIRRSLEFANCKFSDQVLFLETEFEESVDLLSCDFLGRVTFANVLWPPLNQLAASASGTRFGATVTFASKEPPPVQLFQDAEFVSKVAFRGFSDQQIRRAFSQEVNSTTCVEPSLVDPRHHAEAIESGSRTLRQLADATGDVHGEQLWHRAEIIARRRRGETSLAERGFSHLYGLFADYGISIGRPFLSLLSTVIVFAMIYGWLGGSAWIGPSLDLKSIEEGLGYSLNRTFPIGVFADENNYWRQQLLGSAGEFHHIAVRLLATAQTVLSAVLIYLGVMAVRRKFRIS